MSEEEKQLYTDMHAEDELLTSGYTTISSNQGDFKPVRKTLQGIKGGVPQKSTNEDQRVSSLGYDSNAKAADGSKQSAKKSNVGGSAQQHKDIGTSSIGKSSKSKTLSFLDPNSIAAQQFPDPALLQQILNSERLKNLRNSKNTCTLPEYSAEAIQRYREQEEERYNNPTRPWIYLNEDGTTSIVGPVVKKKS